MKKAFIYFVPSLVIFCFICEGILADTEPLKKKADDIPFTIEASVNTIKERIKKGIRSDVWFSKNAGDLEVLRDTVWEFTYKVGSAEYTDSIMFETDVETAPDGTVGLGCFNQGNSFGWVLYTEFPISMGGGRGFAATIEGPVLEEYYFFKITGNAASGYYQSENTDTGMSYDFYMLTGKRDNSDVWISDDPGDLESLCGAIWEFTSDTDGVAYTHVLTFETTVETDDEGYAMLPYRDHKGRIGGTVYSEFPSALGSGYGFYAITPGPSQNQIYAFKISDNSAGGFQTIQDISTGEFLMILPMTGIRKDETEWVKISGSVTYEGTPLCAMVLANGQHMFSCGDDGSYEMEVPLDENGEITLFGFCDGFAPFERISGPWEMTDYDILMSLAGSDSRDMSLTSRFDTTQATPGWVKISGSVTYKGTPLCAMVLANGQYMFSCAGDGKYELEVPLDENGEITLFGFCDGFQPFKQIRKLPINK
ncbi:hypothetical protein QUF80_09305 [Desulfococcaceae bacterium HSG8]|nr:hypothetical protein [Desulfococcaceae bacterium HSG8]